MDNMDDPETNAKVSDSAYSHSCSNSQSRRSHSSKSTHSGSNSSGSSGYGGKASTTGSSNALCQPPKKDKDSKKKKQSQAEVQVADAVPAEPAKPAEPDVTLVVPLEESQNVAEAAKDIKVPEMGAEGMDSTPEVKTVNEALIDSPHPVSPGVHYATTRPTPDNTGGFSCVISMHDGIVMYTSSSIVNSLGFPKDIWLGRSFIDFIHPRDHKTFASMITSGLGLPKLEKGRQGQGLEAGSSMIGRIRRYRSLKSAFGVKDNDVQYTPFLLKFFFKNYCGVDLKVICLVVQATPFHSVFKIPDEVVTKPFSFVIRHGPDGIIEYIDPESIPFLGYLPQDMLDQNAVNLYHPDELPVLQTVYENVVKEGSVLRMRPYRILTQNGDYIQVETEWSSVINPWSTKLEFVIAKHHVILGPTNPDVFGLPEPTKTTEAEKTRLQGLRDNIIGVMTEVRTKPAEAIKQRMGKRCQDLAAFVESLMEKPKHLLRLEMPQHSCHEMDTEMELGVLSPHQDSVSMTSNDTFLSYSQINYRENLQRYFDNQKPLETDSSENGSLINEPRAMLHVSGNSPVVMAQNSSLPMEISPDSSVATVSSNRQGQPLANNQTLILTSDVLTRHNSEMEKKLLKKYRETRAGKDDKEKAEMRKKMDAHMARCSAPFQPTTAGDSITEREVTISLGLKRLNKKPDYTGVAPPKLRCPANRDPLRTSSQPFPTATFASNVAATQWMPQQNANKQIKFCTRQGQILTHPSVFSTMRCLTSGTAEFGLARLRKSMQIQKTSNNSMPGTSGMSMRGTSKVSKPSTSSMSKTSSLKGCMPIKSSLPKLGATKRSIPRTVSMLPCMPGTYGMTGIPAACGMSGMSVMPGMSMPGVVQSQMPMMYGQPVVYSPLSSEMYTMHNVLPPDTQRYFNALNPTTSNYNQASSAAPNSQYGQSKAAKNAKRPFEENAEKTDGETSTSSYYSSVFKTDSGSAYESGDQKNNTKSPDNEMSMDTADSTAPPQSKTVRKYVGKPWYKKKAFTPDFAYQYEMSTKPLPEVLRADQQTMQKMEQPSLVNEQLGQLYLDLQLQGVTQRLTLEEGITSSSSSGEESGNLAKLMRKPKFTKLAIIHEENAPLPEPRSGFLAPKYPAENDDTTSDVSMEQLP